MEINPQCADNRQLQHQMVLLLSFAIFIFLVGIYQKNSAMSGFVSGPGIDILIDSMSTGIDYSNDPRRSLYLFDPVDINRADGLILSSLKGIGPEIAGRIVAFREKNGCFSGPEGLLMVKGIGRKKLAMIRANVTTGPCSD